MHFTLYNILYNLWVITNIVNTKIHFGRATRLVFSVSSSAESARMACRYISIRNLVLYYLWCHNRKVAWFVKYNCDVLIFRHNVEWWAEQMQAYLRSILWAKVEQLEDSYLLTFIIGTSILQQMQTSICIFVCILKKFLTFIKSYGWLFLFKKNLRGFQKPSNERALPLKSSGFFFWWWIIGVGESPQGPPLSPLVRVSSMHVIKPLSCNHDIHWMISWYVRFDVFHSVMKIHTKVCVI